MTITNAVEHALADGPIKCTPWCEYGDGHDNERSARTSTA